MLRRNIPLNYRNVTGVASARDSGSEEASQAPFESTLEYDFLTLLRFDDQNVLDYQTQRPVIRYLDEFGSNRQYTPDVLVTYTDGDVVMYEVKPRDVLWRNWSDYRYRFKQAIKYGKKHGYRFKIVTEKEIRSVYGNNIRFLQNYKADSPYDPRYSLILKSLKEGGESTPDKLIRSLAKSRRSQAELLYTVWRLVADRVVYIDLDEPIQMTSPIWIRKESKVYGW